MARKIVWLLCLYDLKTETRLDRKKYRSLVKRLESRGFSRLQNSVFAKHFGDNRGVSKAIEMLESFLEIEKVRGSVITMVVTDRAFASARTISFDPGEFEEREKELKAKKQPGLFDLDDFFED